jgi:pyrimidine-nucleoside phosphorylase
MRMIDIIHKKKHGKELLEEEIKFFINGYVNNTIPDYQVSALLMAIWFNGMNENETYHLTKAMVESGEQIDLSDLGNIIADKHSTGGIGDKITLIISPILASLGVPIAKMSGRGLGFTGGTIDKLESIEGFNTNLTIKKFKENVKKYGIAIAGQTGNLVPADKKLYALRDVTETVDSIPLIASSIMSKKIASGANIIVLDVKVGSGAFMKDLESAELLAKTMISIGEKFNRKVAVILSNMDQPLGSTVGNKIELQEAVKLLKDNEGEEDLVKLSTEITAYLYYLSGKANSIEEANKSVSEAIASKKAYDKFLELIEVQGGNASSIDNLNVKHKIDIISETEGYVKFINSEDVGIASMMLGAGRATKEDKIDHEVGIELHIKVGDKISKGDKLFTIYSNKDSVDEVKQKLVNSIEYSTEKVEKPNVIHKVIL